MNPASLTRARAFVCVALCWAAIYLPALGSLEIKGEEGRRLLPAQTMLETGRWVVPQIGGVDYFSKPPLINWLAAAAFRVAGDVHSEWAGRAPSALAALALGMCTVWALSGWLGPGGALLAAIFILTNIGLMEKGRLAEIEALYLSLTGIATVLWLGAWRRDVTVRDGRCLWGTWTLPWIFLGLGMLTKGPVHLLFFYAVVVGVLVCAGRGKDLLNWPHLVGVVVMLAIFGAWAVPYLRQTAAGGAGGVWWAQFQGRMEVNEKFRLAAWALNIPRGLANYLPWTVLLPLAFRRVSPEPDETHDAALDRNIARGLRWSVAGCFLLVSLAPGGQPRYTLPLLTPASVLLALVFVHRWRLPTWLPTVWGRINVACLVVAMLAAPLLVAFGDRAGWRWAAALVIVVGGLALLERIHRWRRIEALTLASAAAMALITATYVVGRVPILQKSESVRPQAQKIDDALAGERTAVLRPGFLPFLFYLRRSPAYLQRPDDLPANLRYLLVRENEEPTAEADLHGWNVAEVAARIHDKRTQGSGRSGWLLLRLSEPRTKGL